MKKPSKQDTLSTADKLAGAFVLSLPLQGSLRSQDTPLQGSLTVTAPTPFVTVWKVAAGGDVRFKTTGSFTIDWGDGCVEKVKESLSGLKQLKHQYVNNGTYTVSISSEVTEFWLIKESAKKLIEIKQWGTARWKNMDWMFNGARNMVCTATDTPDTSKVKHMSSMFRECWKFHRRRTNSPIEHWDTKGVENMSNMLRHARMFNQPLAKMDLKAVKQAVGMLEDTPAFNQDLRDLNIDTKADNVQYITGGLFGWDISLADYKRSGCCKYNEKYDVREQQQEFIGVLNGTGAG